MSFVPRIELFKSAKNIKKGHLHQWEKDCDSFAEKMDMIEKDNETFDACLAKKDHEKYQSHLKIYKCDVGNLETDFPEINTLKEAEETLLCIVWDMSSPLLNDDFDMVKPKFHTFKNTMGINNLETEYLEASRSSAVALNDKNCVPYFNKIEELYTSHK